MLENSSSACSTSCVGDYQRKAFCEMLLTGQNCFLMIADGCSDDGERSDGRNQCRLGDRRY